MFVGHYGVSFATKAATPADAASGALAAYGTFALVIWFLVDRRPSVLAA